MLPAHTRAGIKRHSISALNILSMLHESIFDRMTIHLSIGIQSFFTQLCLCSNRSGGMSWDLKTNYVSTIVYFMWYMRRSLHGQHDSLSDLQIRSEGI